MSPQEIAERDGARKGAMFMEIPRQTTTIAVVGLGYVGLPLAILAAAKNVRVIGFDIDEVKVAQLEKREADYLSPEEGKEFVTAQNLSITSDQKLLKRADTYIICVPTPVTKNHMPDLGPLESASEIVGRSMSKGALVIIESTVNPGACEEVALPILEKASSLTRGDFFFAHCPERVNPGDVKWNLRTIPRVIGGLNDESLTRARDLYRSLIDAEIREMGTIKEAEAVKMVENSFRDINIAFVNELAMAFDRAGIDVINVLKGASTKPFGFMAHYPGAGVGGHCIPVDPYYLIRYGKENGFEHHFLLTARRINNGMPQYTVKLLSKMFEKKNRELVGATVALLGLSYKRDIPDLRESPALEIEHLLKRAGANVRSYDPNILSRSTVKTLEEALEGADAAVIATAHTPFCELTPLQFSRAGVQFVLDGRNCLDKDSFKDSGITYHGIGRQ